VEQTDFLRLAVDVLDGLGVLYVVVGSI